jgi:hypothetical protein
VPDVQLAFLTAQLQNIKAQNYTGAVLIAVHHPPFSYSPPPKAGGAGTHIGNTLMLREIDTICQAQGVYPHAFLSGHAHDYQRYTRKLSFAGKNYSVPFIVAGDGGFNVNRSSTCEEAWCRLRLLPARKSTISIPILR